MKKRFGILQSILIICLCLGLGIFFFDRLFPFDSLKAETENKTATETETEETRNADVLLIENDRSVKLQLLSLSNPVSDSLLYEDLHLYLSQGDRAISGMETAQRDAALQWMMDRVDQLQEGMCARMVSEALGAAGLRSGTHFRYTPIAAAGSSCFNFVNENTGALNYKVEAFTWKDLLNHDYAPRRGDVVFFGLISSADMTMKQYARYSDGNGYHVGMMRTDNSSINKISTVDGGQGADLLHIRTIDRSVNPVNGIFNIGNELNIYTTIFVRPCYEATFMMNAYLNYSNKNYIYGSDFSELDKQYYFSSDSAYQTLSIDENETHNSFNSLKIENLQAGSPEKSAIIKTLTMGASNHGDYVGDDRPMTFSFYAKADSKDTKMYFRWGYESTMDARSITLTPYWQKYTIRMDKKSAYDMYMHLYADKAGTVWMSELQLEDGKEASDFVVENETLYDSTANVYNLSSIAYKLPEDPIRDGYIFDGWYDQANGGTKIDDSYLVRNGNLNVFAHWTKAN